jgi:CBS domain containing-hemolysin-like protein
MSPAVALGRRVESVLRRRFPAEAPDDAARESSQEQFREVMEGGLDVSRRERALLHGVFSLGDTSVSDVMVPRVDVVGIDHETPWSEVVDRVRSSEHARFPVYAETVDDITGILYAKDLLPAIILDEEPHAGWLALARAPQFIPATKTLGDQLRDFKASHTHIAIVVDEYGGTAGLVTIEDVLEEIVGDIHDEYDVEEPDVEQEEGKRFWVAGRLTLDELSDVLGHTFDDEAVATVGGLIYQRLGRVPVAGEQLIIDGFRVIVERVVRRRVRRVYFERLEPATAGPR